MCKNKLNIDELYKKYRENILSFLYMLQSEFCEVNELINELKNYEPFHLDVGEATPTHNALNIAVVISYARNFKRSFGFYHIDEINSQLINNFTKDEKKLHNKILIERDKEFAHSDASANDIKIYNEGLFSNSRRRVRQLLEKEKINNLQEMVSKIRNEIENQLQHLK